MALFVGFLVCALLSILLGGLAGSATLGVFLFILFYGAYVINGVREITPTPPTVGLMTIWRARKPRLKREGWRFFGLYPVWEGFIPVKVEKVNLDLPIENVRTPDLAQLTIPVSITFMPAWKVTDQRGAERETPEHLIEYLNTGGTEGVKKILENIVPERLREWAQSKLEGPRDFREALAAQEEAIAVLLMKILGEKLPQIPGGIPLQIVMKHFFWGGLTPEEIVRWKPAWDGLSDAERNDIVRKKEDLRSLVIEARRGDGHFVHPQLGIIINRLNVGEIKLEGKVAETADLLAKEKLEQDGEVVEREHFVKQVTTISADLDIPKTEAAEYFQTERGKITKQVQEKKLNVAPGTQTLLKDLLERWLKK